jgi:TPR repeat protein
MHNAKKTEYMKTLIEKAIYYNRLDQAVKAVEILTQPCLKNNTEALHLIGQIYLLAEKGFSDIKKDIKKTIEYWEKAIELKHSESAYELGKIYNTGYGVKVNLNRAEKYFKLGFEFKTEFYEFCGLELIELYIDINELEKSIEICNKLIIEKMLLGNCYYKLYRIYSTPNTPLYNIDLSIHYLKCGFEQGHVASCMKLANHLTKGKYIEKNINKAITVLGRILENNENDLFFKEAIEKIELLKKDIT